ncbi:hypothetical protein Esti_001632 [Eimeria stiedai]
MSLAGSSLRSVARPPARGSFPLDREHQCSNEQQEYLRCLTHQQQQQEEFEVYDHLPCRGLAKAFLECRMHFNLMQKEDLSRLGYAEPSPPSASAAVEKEPPHPAAAAAAAAVPAVKTKEETGFLAGIQAIQPYTTRGFFGRIAARFSWPKDFMQLRRSGSGSSSSSSSSSNRNSSSSSFSDGNSCSSGRGRTSQGVERVDDFPDSSSSSSISGVSEGGAPLRKAFGGAPMLLSTFKGAPNW